MAPKLDTTRATLASVEKTKTMGRRKPPFVLLLLSAVAALLAFADSALADDPAGYAGTPWVASDKPDYAPGELVTLNGGSWQAGEVVHLSVNDDQGRTWERAVDVTADASGTIVDQFNLPDWFVATYAVTATGACVVVVPLPVQLPDDV